MQQDLLLVIATHFCNFAASSHRFSLTHQSRLVVGIRGQHAVTVLDDNQFTKTDQPISAVNDNTRSRGNDVLAFISGNIDSLTCRISSIEGTDHTSSRGPQP